MKISGRTSLLILILGLFLFLGILFRSIILDYWVRPVAVLLWFLLRILSSVDQAFYWGALLFAASGFAIYDLFLRRLKKPDTFEQATPPRTNATLENVSYWRTMIVVTLDEIGKPNMLRRNLGKMFASICVSKGPGSSSLEVYKALRLLDRPLPERISAELHRISLPQSVYTFLFAEESGAQSGFSIGKTLQAIWQTPRNWVRRLTGRDVAEYFESIEEVVALMESSMEINHDEGTNDTSDH